MIVKCKVTSELCTCWVIGVFAQNDVCELDTQKSVVWKLGGQRGTLKGVLWWLVMALLVGGTLAAHVSETGGFTQPSSAVNKEGKMLEIFLGVVVSVLGY